MQSTNIAANAVKKMSTSSSLGSVFFNAESSIKLNLEGTLQVTLMCFVLKFDTILFKTSSAVINSGPSLIN